MDLAVTVPRPRMSPGAETVTPASLTPASAPLPGRLRATRSFSIMQSPWARGDASAPLPGRLSATRSFSIMQSPWARGGSSAPDPRAHLRRSTFSGRLEARNGHMPLALGSVPRPPRRSSAACAAAVTKRLVFRKEIF